MEVYTRILQVLKRIQFYIDLKLYIIYNICCTNTFVIIQIAFCWKDTEMNELPSHPKTSLFSPEILADLFDVLTLTNILEKNRVVI